MDFVRATRAPIRRLIEGHPTLVFSLLYVHTRFDPRRFHVDKGLHDNDGEGVSKCEILRGDTGDEIFADS